MSTPFDGITWTLRYIEQASCQLPKPDYDDNNPGQPVYSGTDSIYTSPYYEHHPPLLSLTDFIIDITDDESANINFLAPTPSNIITIWAKAQNVYYDRAFCAVRGELMYNKKTGKPTSYFGSHFMISYDGKKGPGGSSQQLSVNLYDHMDIATSTSELLQRKYELNCNSNGIGGSWKADD